MKRSSIMEEVMSPPLRQPVPKADVPKIVLSLHGNANCAERRIARALVLITDADEYNRCTGAFEIAECLPQWRGRYDECIAGLVAAVSDGERRVRRAASEALMTAADRGDETVTSRSHFVILCATL